MPFWSWVTAELVAMSLVGGCRVELKTCSPMVMPPVGSVEDEVSVEVSLPLPEDGELAARLGVGWVVLLLGPHAARRASELSARQAEADRRWEARCMVGQCAMRRVAAGRLHKNSHANERKASDAAQEGVLRLTRRHRDGDVEGDEAVQRLL